MAEKGLEGRLYKISDASGFDGTLSDVPEEITQSPRERGLPRRRLRARDDHRLGRHAAAGADDLSVRKTLADAIGDPTNPTATITVGDPAYPANELTVTVHSSNRNGRPAGEHQRHRQRQRTDAESHTRRPWVNPN